MSVLFFFCSFSVSRLFRFVLYRVTFQFVFVLSCHTFTWDFDLLDIVGHWVYWTTDPSEFMDHSVMLELRFMVLFATLAFSMRLSTVELFAVMLILLLLFFLFYNLQVRAYLFILTSDFLKKKDFSLNLFVVGESKQTLESRWNRNMIDDQTPTDLVTTMSRKLGIRRAFVTEKP